jgi:hypothetical protein
MATAALPLCWNSAWGKSQTEAGQRASRAARARSRPPGRPQPWPRSQGEAPGPKAPAGHVGTARDELEPQDSVARILPSARRALAGDAGRADAGAAESCRDAMAAHTGDEPPAWDRNSASPRRPVLAPIRPDDLLRPSGGISAAPRRRCGGSSRTTE